MPLDRDWTASQGDDTDPLTGVLNRRGFERRLSELPNTGPANLALICVNIDRFKDANDQHGHPVGDQTLIAMAHALRMAVPAPLLVSRFGGDEFVAVFACETQADLSRTLDFVSLLLRSRQEQLSLPRVTFSSGAVLVHSTRLTSMWADCHRAAALCLQHAQRAGRNRSVVGSPAQL